MNETTPESGRHRMMAEAQELLMARREALRLARNGDNETPSFGDPTKPPHPETQEIQQSTSTQALALAIGKLPSHLGWGSAAQTAVLRASAKRQSEKCQPAKEQGPTWKDLPQMAANSTPVVDEETTFSSDGAVSLAPSLGLAILRHKQSAAARLWLLLRAVDKKGSGTVTLDLAREAFSGQDSPLRFCGRRQLRNLFAAGAGLFWQFDDKRIWLRSSARVAQTLGVRRFHGQDVAIPIATLTGGISAVRANLYASFHSGRGAKPIARQTLARKSGIAPRTQRHYDRLCGVSKQINYALGSRLGSTEAQEQAWQQGSASFTWHEKRRGQNRQERRFLAWQLPNNYHGPHARLGRGRQKRQNKALADLLNKGTAGNSQSQIDDLNPRYFADARAASHACSRSSTAVYWPTLKPGIWHSLWLPGNQQEHRTNRNSGGEQRN